MEVFRRVKNFQQFSQKVEMPEQLRSEILNSSSEDETHGKISSFWIKTNPHWHQLKKILKECNEMEAVKHVELLEIFNHKGSYNYMHVCINFILLYYFNQMHL